MPRSARCRGIDQQWVDARSTFACPRHAAEEAHLTRATDAPLTPRVRGGMCGPSLRLATVPFSGALADVGGPLLDPTVVAVAHKSEDGTSRFVSASGNRSNVWRHYVQVDAPAVLLKEVERRTVDGIVGGRLVDDLLALVRAPLNLHRHSPENVILRAAVVRVHVNVTWCRTFAKSGRNEDSGSTLWNGASAEATQPGSAASRGLVADTAGTQACPPKL